MGVGPAGTSGDCSRTTTGVGSPVTTACFAPGGSAGALAVSVVTGPTLAARGSQAEASSRIGEVRGMGPMLAMEFVKDKESKKPDPDTSSSVMKECLKNGLMTLKAGLYNNAIRLHPPLTIDDELLETGLGILEAAVKKYA